MNWTKVEDALPDKYVYVQGYCKGKYIDDYLGECFYCGDDEWHIFNPNKDIFKVTHWAVLPESPEN